MRIGTGSGRPRLGHRREAVVEKISRLYGTFATPVAYLIDEEGTIAADAAVGVEPILALLSNTRAAANGAGQAPRREKEVVPLRR